MWDEVISAVVVLVILIVAIASVERFVPTLAKGREHPALRIIGILIVIFGGFIGWHMNEFAHHLIYGYYYNNSYPFVRFLLVVHTILAMYLTMRAMFLIVCLTFLYLVINFIHTAIFGSDILIKFNF